MNSHRHRVGVDFFLHQVNPEEQDWPTEYPMAPMDEPVYSTLYTYSTYAFLLQNEVFRHIVPSIHLQVLCKGLREFNENGVRQLLPNLETGKPRELIMYVHSELNLVSFLKRTPAIRSIQTSYTSSSAQLRNTCATYRHPYHYA